MTVNVKRPENPSIITVKVSDIVAPFGNVSEGVGNLMHEIVKGTVILSEKATPGQGKTGILSYLSRAVEEDSIEIIDRRK